MFRHLRDGYDVAREWRRGGVFDDRSFFVAWWVAWRSLRFYAKPDNLAGGEA